jgi:2,4-dienoyl-CoA reductase-like NADH-dependent reductase (Old Yellow Enzyme family)
MTTYSSLPNGDISPDELPYLRRRAEGGFGIVMTAACCVHPSGWAFEGQFACWDDRFIPSLEAVASAIHDGGAKAVLQIHHGGRQCPPTKVGGQAVSASAIPADREGAPVPRELTTPEIEELVDSFAAAAVRARTAGFDGVEIHGANTYLLQQFVSPHSNRREDAWGQYRLKFPLAVTDAILAAVPGFSVGYRFSPEEPETPGIRIEQTLELVDELVQRPLDFLHVSLRTFDQASMHASYSDSTLTHLVRHLDDRMPLIGVGGVKSAEDVEAVLARGASLVAIGRVGISDPEFPKQTRDHQPVRTKIPAGNFRELLTLPAGLAAKIEAVPGWFEREAS